MRKTSRSLEALYLQINRRVRTIKALLAIVAPPRFPSLASVGILFFSAAVTSASAQSFSFTTLADFNLQVGETPYGTLIQGSDGNFYGTTSVGGPDFGTVYTMTPSGTLTELHDFTGPDGMMPRSSLIQGSDGNFYGTTSGGGYYRLDGGTVFKITPGGTLTTLHSFSGPDGLDPYGGLVQGSDGFFYGTTYHDSSTGNGNIFKMTANGTLGVIHHFHGSDGALPYASMIRGNDGNFYGTTVAGGTGTNCGGGCGTVFKITPEGTLTTLHSFNLSDGSQPFAGLVLASDGNFYGATFVGGTTCGSGGCGTIFKMTPDGTLTTLYSFSGPDGSSPYGTLVQGSDGNLYGTTKSGGSSDVCGFGCGTVFRITRDGTLTTLHSFDGGDGGGPFAGLVQGRDGFFYGTTAGIGGGTVFRIGAASICATCRP